MKNIKNLILLLSIVIFAFSCHSAEDIRAREKAKMPVKIVKAVKPNNLGVIKKVSPSEFQKLIDSNVGVLVDVRTPDEYAESHLKDAVNINFKKRTFPDYINAIDKNKPVLIYCRSANRSGKAALIMQSLGFKEIYDLDKGYKGWNAANMAIVTEDNDANKTLQEKLSKGELKGVNTVGKFHQIDVAEFEKLISGDDVTLVDVRTPKEFATGHIEGAVNVDWKNRHFAENILKITDEKPVAIYCRSGNRATRAMFAMGAIGFKEVYNLTNGVKSWKAEGMALKTLEVKGDIEHLDNDNFNNAILGQVGTLVDVRTPKEYASFHIPGAQNVDWKNSDFEKNFTAKHSKDTPVLIYCRTGIRSGKAMKALKKMGYKVYNLNKGVKNWKSKGMPVEGNNVNAKQSQGEEGC